MNIKTCQRRDRAYCKATCQGCAGRIRHSLIRQRPILLDGPPHWQNAGWTGGPGSAGRHWWPGTIDSTTPAVSAVGPPFIRQRHYGDMMSVTEYTMSEIIASIYAKNGGHHLLEGILFIDEINYASGRRWPHHAAILQQDLWQSGPPAGWVIVAGRQTCRSTTNPSGILTS